MAGTHWLNLANEFAKFRNEDDLRFCDSKLDVKSKYS